ARLPDEAWLAYNAISLGGDLDLGLGEFGQGTARVVAIGPAPAHIDPNAPARGTVLMTSRRTDAPTVDVYLDGQSTALAITAEHPVWSLTRDAWVPAAYLQPGELVATASGSATVLAVGRGHDRTVYNFEVHGDRTFYAGDSGAGQKRSRSRFLPRCTARVPGEFSNRPNPRLT
ncbi:MAG: hypothetical protein AAFX79_00005, partial [Planctomycetota bacterium]